MRALTLLSLVITLAVVGLLAKRQLAVVQTPAMDGTRTGAPAAPGQGGDTAVTSAPAKVQAQLDAIARQQAQRPDAESAAPAADGGKP